MASFGDKLKKLRSDADMTQEDLAKKLDVTRSAVGMYEQGKRMPDFEHLDALADMFDVSFDYLLGSGEMIENYPRHGDEAMIRRLKAYHDRILTAYDKASPDTQAAVRAILHLEG